MTTHNTTHEISLNNLSLAPEPIAIVGIGCRFPGGSSGPQAFWDNLLAGKDCIVDVPKNRWDVNRFYDADKEKPGKMYVKSGGFLHEAIDEFDALFFGISPREAAALDPQQRVLLEVSWEALEDAGIDPDSLSGSSTGVFVGGFMLDNKLTQLNPLNRHTIASNTAVGMTLTMLSNRISYLYDLRGPSMSIDTACSSSMVALDQACRSIWTGDSSLALVGGVNIMHRPEIFIAMCKGGFLAPDGRSKAFDERGDGYGRGEGAGIVVLKLLRDAERDGEADALAAAGHHGPPSVQSQIHDPSSVSGSPVGSTRLPPVLFPWPHALSRGHPQRRAAARTVTQRKNGHVMG